MLPPDLDWGAHSPASPETPSAATGGATVGILVACLGAPLVIIVIVVFAKRCYRRLKRKREVSDRRDDLQGIDNLAMDFHEPGAGLVRSVGGSVVIVNGTIRPSPVTGRHKPKKRCYDEDSIDYGEEGQAFPDDILAEIDASHGKVKSNGIEMQLEERARTPSLSDYSSYAQEPRIQAQMNGHANVHLPKNGVKCTAVSIIADSLKDSLGKNHNNNELSIRDCEIIIHAIEREELKVKPKLFEDECPLKRMTPERMTMPGGPIPFPRRKSSTPSLRSLKGSKNAASWLHSAYVARTILNERSG